MGYFAYRWKANEGTLQRIKSKISKLEEKGGCNNGHFVYEGAFFVGNRRDMRVLIPYIQWGKMRAWGAEVRNKENWRE